MIIALSRSPFLLATMLVMLFSCTHHATGPVLFERMEHTGIDFQNTVKDGPVENSFLFRNFYNGGGVAIGDINNDSLPDVFLTSNSGSNKLYLNKGNFQFEDITDKAGFQQDSMWSTGVVFVDINNDGWLDIYISNSGHMSTGHRKNKLYINNHNGTFTESAAKYGLDISAYTTQVSFFDYDMDGDLDCFMINNSPVPVNTLNNSNRRDLPDKDWPVANFLKGGGDHLFRNDNGHFTEVTKQAGIHGSLISFGLGVSVSDVNNDGLPDVFVSNDSYERDYLYINQGNGTFKDELETWFGHTSFSSMGADIADINNDGLPDIFTTDMLPEDDYRLKTLGAFDNIELYNAKLKAGFFHQYMKNCLQLNNGNRKYCDIANYSGVSATDWSWGALLFDMDNDGFNDIFVCNGVNKDVTNLDFMDFFANDVIQKMVLTGKKDQIGEILNKVPIHPMLHKAYQNVGDLHFADKGQAWGFTDASFANGAAYGDLNNDGTLDLIINNENGPAFIYKNNARTLSANHFVAVSLKGSVSNTFAIGSKIKVFSGATTFYRELFPSRGFQSSTDYKQVIGIGKLTAVDSMEVVWPNGTLTVVQHPAIDKTIFITESANALPSAKSIPQTAANPLLAPVTATFDKHIEDNNNDFNYERNLPKMLSREGPKSAIGDLNGDGLPDIFIGGTPEHPGQVYLQQPDGKYSKKEEPAFARFISFEDEAVLLFDADGDGDLDLFIGPGGNSNPPYSSEMQNRLFKNDGKGNFTLEGGAFPSNPAGMNTSVAIAYDFNKDGFPDLFVGGRSVPREYGSSPASFLYINDGKGHFRDIANEKNPDIAHIGMVTGAIFADVAGDTAKELIIVGEWMSPKVYSFQKDHFVEIHTNLSGLSGWWETIAVADLNGDGKMDLVLGNIGENFYLHPDSAHPVKLWVSDFDNNGIQDNIMTRSIDGKDMTVFLKRDLEIQLPVVKKQNLKHGDYAQKSIDELLPKPMLAKAAVKLFNYCSSIVAMNQGGGNFAIEKLPAMSQLSSINAIQCVDLNNDGKKDIVTGGNEFGFLPQFGRLDGSFGGVLINEGNGKFQFQTPMQSGLQLDGQIRDIQMIKNKDVWNLLFLRNDEIPVLYSIKSGMLKQ